MISKGLFTQIAMIALAVGIAFFYIKPAFSDISQMQDDISLYQSERQKVDAVNSQLASLVSQLNSISATDQRRLLTYIPDEVDKIAVPRTLQAIAQRAGVIFRSVGYGEVVDSYISESEKGAVQDYPIPQSFNVTIQGTYQQIKNVLSLLESNEYPLEVHEIQLNVLEGGFLTANLTIITYSHTFPEESAFKNN